VSGNPIRVVPPPRRKSCNTSDTVSRLTSQLGLSLSSGDVAQLVNAIDGGGSAGMALAQFIADAIANGGDAWTPQLTTTITSALDRPEYRGLLLTNVVRMHLLKLSRRP
jgi:hypothetical protein